MSVTVTIVTAVLDGVSTIAACLDSVRAQSPCVEHIVVDGGSTDGTRDIVRAAAGNVRLIAEPDRGLYDAMNKGIESATGDLVGILNADDVYSGPDVLDDVAGSFANAEVDCSYGDLLYVGEDGRTVTRRWRAGRYEPGRFRWGWMPPHPTFFVRRRFYSEHGTYRLDLGTSADYELMLRFLVCRGLRPAYIPRALVMMREGGASGRTLRGRLLANRMDRRAWEVNSLRPLPWTILAKPLRKIPQYLT